MAGQPGGKLPPDMPTAIKLNYNRRVYTAHMERAYLECPTQMIGKALPLDTYLPPSLQDTYHISPHYQV